MARPRRCRRVCSEPDYSSFMPDGIPCSETVTLAVDEYEVIRLIDLEKLTHEQCAKRMDISRTTATEIYESAREKIADSIVNGKRLIIEGGDYRLCDGSAVHFCRKRCGRASGVPRIAASAKLKGDHEMRIAVTFENGNVFQHFGHTEQFKLYDVENGSIVKEQVADTNDSGHGALSALLSEWGVDAVICGGIGQGAVNALSERGICVVRGVDMDARMALAAFAKGALKDDSDASCHHHEHEGGHDCGSHSCAK